MTPTQAPTSDAEILRTCADLLKDRLPDAWLVNVAPQVDSESTAVLTVTTPFGQNVEYVVEVKSLLVPRDVPAVDERLQKAADSRSGCVQKAVISRYLTPSIRKALADKDVSFIDVTGNMLVRSPQPALFVRDRGEDKDPGRARGRPRANLKGEPAARIVRTLVDVRGPWSARKLVETSGASTGATYRVLEFLQEEDLVEKTSQGYVVKDWPSLLRRWSQDYGFLSDNRTFTYLEPRGVDALLRKAADSQYAQYAVTSSIAARRWTNPDTLLARAAMIYVDDATKAADEWGLKATDKGTNVILAEPKYDVVFRGAVVTDQGNVIVAPAQAAIDLLTGPGRNPSEGDELISWMETHEDAWRNG